MFGTVTITRFFISLFLPDMQILEKGLEYLLFRSDNRNCLYEFVKTEQHSSVRRRAISLRKNENGMKMAIVSKFSYHTAKIVTIEVRNGR